MRPERPLRPRRDAGHTLVGLVAAMSVIAVALLGNLSMVTFGIQSKESRQELSIARRAAADLVEEMRAVSDPVDGTLSFSEHVVEQVTGTAPVSDTTVYTVSIPGLHHSATADGLGQGRLTFSTVNGDLLEVKIRIEWEGVRGTSSHEALSLIGMGYEP